MFGSWVGRRVNVDLGWREDVTPEPDSESHCQASL